MKKIVLALGGNALGNSPQEQQQILKQTAKSIVDLKIAGNEIIIVHGNGPQVGMINKAMEYSYNNSNETPSIPFPECGAMSQGYIGFHLQQAIRNELIKRKRDVKVVSLISQMLVDENDEAFNEYTKPIGSFYTESEMKEIVKNTGYIMKEDANRGYRRVVASPKPVEFLDKEALEGIIEKSMIAIVAGGGGIPVIMKNGEYVGVDAVIDKDFAASKVANIINADALFILTAVDKVAINFGKETQQNLDVISVSEARQYIIEGQFHKGSMLPKVEAALEFVESNNDREAVICSLENANEALYGKNGTKIIKK